MRRVAMRTPIREQPSCEDVPLSRAVVRDFRALTVILRVRGTTAEVGVFMSANVITQLGGNLREVTAIAEQKVAFVNAAQTQAEKGL